MTATTVPIFRESRGGWIESPGWDFFWMFSALWGCVLLLLLSSAVGMRAAGVLLFFFNALIALTHSWSTTYMVIASPLLREARRRNRFRYTAIPLAVVAGSIGLGLLLTGTHALPANSELGAGQALWALYLALFWMGHFWHFGNQDFGVLSIYRLKAGQSGLRDRRADKLYAVAMMFVIQPIVYLKAVAGSPLSDAFFSYAPAARAVVEAVAPLALFAAVGLTAAAMAFEISKPDASMPKLLYYAVMLSHPTLLYFVRFELGFFYLIAYLWSHWFIAIGLVGRINVNYQRSRGSFRPAIRHVVAIGVVVTAVTVLSIGYHRFRVFSGADYLEVLNSFAPQYSVFVGFFLGFFLAEQLLHYYCDRCLFRFRDSAIREVVAPLL